MTEDIYDNEERISYEDEDEVMECFGCGWVGSEYFIIREFGMEWYLCPYCNHELI